MTKRLRLLVGDVREKLGELADGSVQTVVTSPPYWGLRDYGADGQIGLEPTPVLDPFAGSGTTLQVALELGRRAVGIEINPEYAAMAQERCRGVQVPLIAPGAEVLP